ncbi:hypothetical protein R1flu_027059 [Riccia fluitans]|uniref:Amine oxidase domain-containing protein n=1 Tax=Riccia fluitans TaxID=41844 RepID=A0ABD1XKQ9_9MARC
MREDSAKVVVVGAGLAGLSAAEVLSSQSDFRVDSVVVLEAASELGGRIQNVAGLAPWPVEIGPEFLHGTQNSSVKKLVDEMGCVQRELNFHILQNARENMLHELFKALVEENSSVPDMSIAEYLQKKGVSETVMGLAEAIYGNDFGCSLDKLGLYECIQEANQWIYGDTYIILDRPLSSVVNYISRNLHVLVNWAVKQVEQLRNGDLRLHSHDGRTLRAQYVILTVPVTILQQKLISFLPPLPESKIRAAEAIGMSNVMKVVMAFSQRFWPRDMFDVVCSHCFLPEVWMTEYPKSEVSSPSEDHKDRDSSDHVPLGNYIVVGFIAGDRASKVAKMSEVEILRQSLTQLDRMFGTAEVCTSSNSKVSGRVFLRKDVVKSSRYDSTQSHPASSFFSGGVIVNWADRSFIRGGYSHPSVNAGGARRELAKPVGNIFFAGEATHPGVNPCLQAAIDTGRRAAHEVIGASKRRSAL